MNSQYALGTSYPPTVLDQFDPAVPWPVISEPVLYPVAYPRGDGSEAGHGLPQTIWRFQFLTEAEKKALAAICTVSGVERKSRTGVYITTRIPQDLDAFATYTAAMILPDWREYRQINGLYYDTPIIFRQLVAYP